MIPSFFTRPPERAPTAAGAEWSAVVRHAQAAPPMPSARLYHVAVDIWQGGAHLWRSWPVAEGRSVDDWVEAEHGPDAPRNHDDGVWAAPGVQNIADWPIPPATLSGRAYSVGGLRDAMITLCAIGQAAGREAFTWEIEIGALPGENTLRGQLRKGWTIVAWEAAGMTYRAFITAAEAASRGDSGAPKARWRAELARRQTRIGVEDVDFTPVTVIIEVPRDAPIRHLARLAKESLGITGWPAIRQPRTMEWHLARAPWKFTLEEVE